MTTSGEFHTLRRLMARLAEEELLDVVVVEARPAETLAERLAAETTERTAAVLVSAVLFEDSQMVPGLDQLAAACETRGAELLVDVYHALGVMSFPLDGLGRPGSWAAATSTSSSARATASCACRPTETSCGRASPAGSRSSPSWRRRRRPARSSTRRGGMRFAGATYDPTSHYRAARVFDFFAEQGLTPRALRENYLRQTTMLADALGVEGRREDYGGFVAVEVPDAEEVSRRLAKRA